MNTYPCRGVKRGMLPHREHPSFGFQQAEDFGPRAARPGGRFLSARAERNQRHAQGTAYRRYCGSALLRLDRQTALPLRTPALRGSCGFAGRKQRRVSTQNAKPSRPCPVSGSGAGETAHRNAAPKGQSVLQTKALRKSAALSAAAPTLLFLLHPRALFFFSRREKEEGA